MRQLGSLVRRCASPRPGARTLRWSRPDAPAGRRPWRSGGVRRSWSAVRRYRRRSSSVIRRGSRSRDGPDRGSRAAPMARAADAPAASGSGASAGVRDRHDGGNCRVPRIGKAGAAARPLRDLLPSDSGRRRNCCARRSLGSSRPILVQPRNLWAAPETGKRQSKIFQNPGVLACGCRGRLRREERRWWAAEPNATGELDGQVPVSTHSITASADVGVPAVARYSRTIARATSRSRLP